MAKTFKGFTNQQTHQLLKEMGFTGPAQKDEMDAFLASSPSAASKMGRYTEIAKQRVEGGPLSGVGMQRGGTVDEQIGMFNQASAAMAKGGDEEAAYKPVSRITSPTPSTPTARETTSTDASELKRMLNIQENYPNATEEQRDLLFENEKAGEAYGTATTRIRNELGIPEQGMTPQQAQQLEAALKNTPEFKAMQDTGEAVQASMSLGMSPTRTTGTRMVGSPVDELGRPELRVPSGEELITKPGEQVTQIPPPEGAQVLKPGTPTPEVSPAAELLDVAQETYAGSTRDLTAIQQAMSGKDPEEVYKTRDYTSVADGTDDERRAAGTALAEKLLQHVVNTTPLTPEEITKYDLNGDGEVNLSDVVKFQKMAVGLSEPNEAFTEFFLNKYPTTDVTYQQALEEAELAQTQAAANVSAQEAAYKIEDIPSTAEALGKAITNPSSVLSQPTVYGLKVENNQLIDENTGQVATAASLLVKQAQAADAVEDPAVKSAMAYVQGLSEAEIREKYPPYSKPIPAVTPLPPEVEKDIADYYERQQAQIAQDAIAGRAETYEAVMSQDKVKTALETFAAATGTPSEDALMKAETMDPEELAQLGLDAITLDTIRQIPEMKRQLDEGEIPTAALFDEYTKSEAAKLEGEVEEIDPAKFETETPKAEAEVDYNLPPTQVAETEATKVEEAAKFDEYATAEEKKSEFVPEVTAEETTVGADEVVDVNKIINEESVIVTAKTLEALNEASTAKAATATFSQQLQAKAVKGDVGANSTVQGQMEKLMASFDDGTPAWAAGALRKANAAMSARGLGNSSMASAAIIQATLESAIPIAQQDAATFAAMDMENVRNEQAVALANAAAAQNFELANLSNEQAVRIQNSMNNANLQLNNLSNEQEAVLATAQFKAALQGQELSISANVALANAARYAAVNDINLTNRQQTSILKSTQNLEVEMANLSNSQQTALSNLQVKAAMMGQELTNEQQVAVLESTQAFESEMQDATMKQQAFIQDAVARAAMEGRVLDNKQQTALFNVSNVVAERGIELNNEQQTAVFNMSNKLQVDMAEMSNRQQTALANAQIEAAMKGQELSNKQQVNVITAERIAEIANVNFTAEQSRALQNAQLAQTVDLANLSNEQAKLMADVASMAQLDMANLNNRQQAAAQQASAFLEMDMANLDNEQQAVMFEAQSLVQSILSDQAAENAQLQFNAESINQVNQFFESMSTQVQQFNTAQENAMEQFNAGEENSMTKFQAELDNQRDMFNAQNELVIAQANTVWRQTVATANTAALNEANMTEVMAANNLTMQGLNELWQQERDLMNYAWTSAENVMTRENQLLINKIAADGAEDSALASAGGQFLSGLFTNVLFGAGNFEGIL